MAFIGGRGSGSEENQTAANLQLITLDQFLELLDLTTKQLLKDIRKEWGLTPKKDTFDDTVLQNLNETVYSKEELIAEDEIILNESLESVDPYEKESLKNLQLFDLKETFPELNTQQKGKYLKRAGIFKTKRRIGGGTLQFLYKNGLFNLFKECCAVFKEQDIVDIQYKMESQDFELINVAGGIKLRKKVKKKKKKGKKRKREKEKRWL